MDEEWFSVWFSYVVKKYDGLKDFSSWEFDDIDFPWLVVDDKKLRVVVTDRAMHESQGYSDDSPNFESVSVGVDFNDLIDWFIESEIGEEKEEMKTRRLDCIAVLETAIHRLKTDPIKTD